MGKSLATRLLFIGICVLALTGVVHSFVFAYFQQSYDEANQLRAIADEIVVQTLQARRAEKDFQLRSLHDGQFFKEGRSEFLDKHQMAMAQLRHAVQKFLSASPDYDREVIDHLLRLITTYEKNFQKYVMAQRALGAAQATVIRHMHQTIHQAAHLLANNGHSEQLMSLHELEDILSTYSARGDRHLLIENEKILNNLHQAMQIDPESEIGQLLSHFRASFSTYITQWERIGLNENQGFQGVFRQAIHQVEPIADLIRAHAAQEVQTAYQRLIWFTLLVYFLASLVGCLVFFIFSRRITDSLVRLKDAVLALGGGSIDARVEVPQPEDEVKILAQTFNQVTDQLRLTTVSKEYVDRILQNMAEALLVVDPQGNICTTNPAAARLLEYVETELTGIPFRQVAGIEGEALLLARLDQTEGIENLEMIYHTRLGEAVPVLFSGAAMHKANGAVEGFVCVAQSIRERKAAEEKIQQYNRELELLNADKDRFFSIISHDLKSPFTILLGFAELLLMDLDTMDKPEIREMVQHLFDAAQRQHRLLEDLLTWSRLQMGRMACQPRPLDPYDVVKPLIALFADNAAHKKIQLINRVRPGNSVQADPDMLSTILRNLLSNALKFTKSGGKVILSGQWDHDSWRLSVTDTGVGMETEEVNNLFRLDRHHSTHGTANEPGTGLGLILCKELALKMGGDLTVESVQGRGTTFHLLLPPGEPSSSLRADSKDITL